MLSYGSFNDVGGVIFILEGFLIEVLDDEYEF